MSLLVDLLIIVLIFVISAIPLYFAVKFVRGKTTIFKAAMINLLVGLIVGLISFIVPFIGFILGFIVLLLMYRYFFRISFLKALFVWFLEIIIVYLLWLLAIFIGVTSLAAMFLF